MNRNCLSSLSKVRCLYDGLQKFSQFSCHSLNSGEDEASVNSKEALESVSEKVTSHAVALKLTAGSETAKQFGAIYPVLIVPSTFIIKNGVPLDIIAGQVKAQDFLAKIEKAVTSPVNPVTQPSSSSNVGAVGGSSSPKKSRKPGVIELSGDGLLKAYLDNAGDDLVVVDFTASWCPPCKMIAPIFQDLAYKYHKGALFIKVDVDKCKITAGMYGVRSMPTFIFFRNGSRLCDINGANASALENRILELIRLDPIQVHNPYADNNSPSLSLDERRSIAESRLEELRQRREQESEEKEINDELQRRNLGKEMAKAKRAREDQEMKEALDQRKKDALLEKEARARVLQQIQADREERKRRFDNQKQWINEPGESDAKRPASAGESGSTPVIKSTANADSTRIQLRFGDGLTLAQEFKSKDNLSVVRNFIINDSGISIGKFSLSTTFPRKVFKEEDMSKTLYDLSLVPSSVLLVIPETGSAVANKGFFSYLPWFILVPFIHFWKFIMTFLPTTPPPAIPPARDEGRLGSRNTSPGDPQPSTSGTSNVRNRKTGAAKPDGGNIHRLHEAKEGNEDDNNTWNGNSTQQM